MRAVLCVDVEPDLRETELPGPAKWEGADLLLADHDWLRAALSCDGSDQNINWFIRIDPQIEGSHGTATWGAERYADALDALTMLGDEVGLHPHNWRWSVDDSRWVSDGSDAWVEEVVLSSLEGFEKVYGRRCRSYRHGDRFVSDVLVSALLADPDIVVDLTLEPGTPSVWGLVEAERTVGITRHVDLRLSRRYQPADGYLDIAVVPDGRLTIVPLTTAVLPASATVETAQLWREPTEFQRMMRLRFLDPDLDHLAFAVRTDFVLSPLARAAVEKNLRWLAHVVPELEWSTASSMALPTHAPVAAPVGVAGSLGRELDHIAESLGVRTYGPARVSHAVDRLVERADGAGRAADEVRQRSEELQAELTTCRAAHNEASARLSVEREHRHALESELANLERELTSIRRTVTWRVRQRMLPVLRPLARLRHRFLRG